MKELPCYCPYNFRKKRWNWIKNHGRIYWIQVPTATQIGTNFGRREAKCLCPHIKPDQHNFNPAEDELIIRLYTVCTKWSEIAEYLPGRTENDIRRHWNGESMKMKVQNKLVAQALASRGSTSYDDQVGSVHETKNLLSRFLENEEAAGERFNCNNNNRDGEINLKLKIGPPTEIVRID